MGHWVCFYISFFPNKYILFFDSYGLKPHIYSLEFSKWLKLYPHFQLKEFGRQIQPDDSQKCGLYVINFIYLISHFGLPQYKLFFETQFSIKKKIISR